MDEGFTVAGQSMPRITIGFGAFLIAWGVIISLVSKSDSITSFFPSLLGLPILISGIMAQKVPEKRKLWMHIAVIFGLFAFLGGLDFFRGFAADGGPFANLVAGASKLMLAITGAIFVLGCVKSFIWARKAREE